MPFSISMTWREPKDHFQDSYFYLVNVKGFGWRHRKKITYRCPNLDSASTSAPLDLSMPAPLPLEDGLASLADEVVFDEDSSSAPSQQVLSMSQKKI